MNIINFAKNNCVLCAVLAVGAVLFTSCESSISIKANKDSSTQIQVNADVGPIVYNTIKAVTAGMSEMAASGNQAYIYSMLYITESFPSEPFRSLVTTVLPCASIRNVD